jgi:TadE-like protein
MNTRWFHLLRALRRSRGERGQAIIEIALVLPLLCLLVLIFVSFGKAVYIFIEMTHVANEGAREASVNLPNPQGTPPILLPGGSNNLTTYLCNEFGGGSYSKVTISYPDTSPPSAGARSVGEPVKISVSTDYHPFPIMNLGAFTITGSATMRIEQATTLNQSLDPKTTPCAP